MNVYIYTWGRTTKCGDLFRPVVGNKLPN